MGPPKISMEEIVRLHKNQTTQGLSFIADKLNNIVDKAVVVKVHSGNGIQVIDKLPSPEDRCWLIVEDIVESMTDQVSRHYPGPQSIFSLVKGEPWDPSERTPHPEISIKLFNAFALKHPVPLFIFKGKGEKEIYPEHNPANEIQLALWYLWRFFFHERGWERLKRCPKCLRWFVDDTRNKQKLRCSRHCTWQWWSRKRRKKSGHQIPDGKKRRKEG